jgi:hypothetical protein
MKIRARVVVQPYRDPYPEIKILCDDVCELSHYSIGGAEFCTYSSTPDELEAAAQALLDLAHALRAELSAYEERKGQAQDEVQP